MHKKCLVLLLFLPFSFVLINADVQVDCSSKSCAAQEQAQNDARMCVVTEEDLFGEPEMDDPTLIPAAPNKVIEVPQPTASQALLQKVGCTLIAGYLVCRKCAGRMWRKLKSVY